jgi:hypothetical protein
MNYQKIQQGDVLLLKVSKEEFEKKGFVYKNNNHDERAVLEFGEGTGHAHAIYMEDLLDNAECFIVCADNTTVKGATGVTLCKRSEWNKQNQGVIIEGGFAQLKHEEHDTITLEPGYYLQRIVKEYDHISGITRGVID